LKQITNYMDTSWTDASTDKQQNGKHIVSARPTLRGRDKQEEKRKTYLNLRAT